MGCRPYSQWMQPGAALGPVHTLAHGAHAVYILPCRVPYRFPLHGRVTVMCNGPHGKERGGRTVEEPVAGKQLAQKTETSGVHA